MFPYVKFAVSRRVKPVCSIYSTDTTCPGDLIYSPCVDACPQTCDEPLPDAECRRIRMDGCVCPPEHVRQGDRCIPRIEKCCESAPTPWHGVVVVVIIFFLILAWISHTSWELHRCGEGGFRVWALRSTAWPLQKYGSRCWSFNLFWGMSFCFSLSKRIWSWIFLWLLSTSSMETVAGISRLRKRRNDRKVSALCFVCLFVCLVFSLKFIEYFFN